MRELRLTIVKDGTEIPLVLERGVQMNAEEHESVFELDKAIRGGYSTGFKIPVAGNERTLDYRHILMVNQGFRLYTCYAYEGSVLIYRGTLAIEEHEFRIDGAYYDANFIVEEYSALIQNVRLHDVLDGIVHAFPSGDAEEIAGEMTDTAMAPENYPFCFPPFRNEKFYEDSEELEGVYKGMMNRWDVTAGEYSFNSPGALAKFYIAPWLNLLYVLRKCFEYKGYSVEGSAMDDAWLKKQVIWGNFSLDNIHNNRYAEFRKTGTTLISGNAWQNVPFDEVVEDFTPAQNATTGNEPYPVAVAATMWVRMILYVGETDALAIAFGQSGSPGTEFTIIGPQPNTVYDVAFQVTYTGAEGFEGIVMRINAGATLEVLPGTTIMWQDDSEPTWNKWPDSFELKRCVPNELVSSFLVKAKSTYGLRFDVDSLSKKVVVTRADELWENITPMQITASERFRDKPRREKQFRVSFDGPVFDSQPFGGYNTVAHTGLMTFVPSLPKQLLLSKAENELYQGSTDNPVGRPNNEVPVGYSGGEPDEVKLKMQLAQMRWLAGHDDYPAEKSLMPVFTTAGSSDHPTAGNKQWPLVFMTFHGLQEDAIDDENVLTYPLASPYSVKAHGDQIPDCESFDLAASNSVLNKQKRMLKALALNRTVEVTVYDDAAKRIRPGKWVMYRGNPWLVKRKELLVGSDRPVKLELVPWV